MAISRDKKNSLVSELTAALKEAQLTAFASYQGLSVADMQELRKNAREADVTIKVTKNRLFRVAMSQTDTYKESNTDSLTGQLVYALSGSDEIQPAKVLHEFAKTHPQLDIVGGFSKEGLLLSKAEVTDLAGLPSRDELIGSAIEQLLAPTYDVTNALSGNLHALLDGIEAHAA